ncbi:MAG: DUF4386 domain-containing protein, partial [Candidatus Eiseniibacteriota bacterium]
QLGGRMTRRTNARLAGFTFLFYIAAGISSMVLHGVATHGEGTAEKLASIAQHTLDFRISILLGLLECFSALILAVTLYGLTRDEDHELAMLVLACRVGEGVLGATGIPNQVSLLRLATTGTGSQDAATTNLLGTFLLMPGPSVPVSAILFAVGSAIFSYLLLRGRMIPAALAWLGVIASVLLVVGLPLQLAGFLTGPVTGYLWMPMLLFEVPLGLWLLIRGVTASRPLLDQ